MTVRARGYVLPFLGFKAKEIDADLRRQMEHIWRREFGGTNPDKKIACPDCGHMFVTDSGMQQHRAAKHGSSAAS